MESRKKSGVGWAVFIVIVAVAFAAYSAINMQQMEHQSGTPGTNIRA